MRFAAIMVMVVLAGSSLSQEGPKPGPEYKILKDQEGTWESSMKFGDAESKGTMVYKMDLGGMWLSGALESELFGQKFSGKSLDSYDPIKKKYVSIWVDSMSPRPVIMEGTYDEGTKILTMAGEGPDREGKSIKYKSVSKMPAADTMEMTMYMGEGKDPSFVITYKRKK